jgi:cation transport regulator ChaC
LPIDDLVRIVMNAHGKYGSCFEYVEQTHIALQNLGIHDVHLEDLVNRIRMSQDQR